MRKERPLLIEPNNWTICSLFREYHDEVRKLKEEHRKKHIDFPTFYDKKEKLEKRYARAVYLIFTNDRLAFSDLMTVETFITIVNQGGINCYDGCGDWIDWDGNEIGGISWEETATMPDNAMFVAWYNK